MTKSIDDIGQCFIEMTDEYKLTEKQTQMIKNDLQLVFTNVTSEDCKEEPQTVETVKSGIVETLKKHRSLLDGRIDIKRYC